MKIHCQQGWGDWMPSFCGCGLHHLVRVWWLISISPLSCIVYMTKFLSSHGLCERIQKRKMAHCTSWNLFRGCSLSTRPSSKPWRHFIILLLPILAALSSPWLSGPNTVWTLPWSHHTFTHIVYSHSDFPTFHPTFVPHSVDSLSSWHLLQAVCPAFPKPTRCNQVLWALCA